jgi:hypothetical protein
MLLYKGHLLSIICLLVGLFLLMPSAAHTADYSPGAPCSSSGAFHQTNDANGMDFLICDGANWQSTLYFGSAGGLTISSLAGQPAPQFNSGITLLDQLNDVDTTGKNTNDVLAWDGSSWGAAAPGGGGSGTPGGANTQIQFNSSSTFGGSANLTWNDGIGKFTVTGDIDYTGVITDISDRRLKENITPLTNSLEGVLALQAYSFTMKDDATGDIEYGLIAQDVQAVFPHLVKTRPNGTMALNYMGLFGPLVEAIKEQQQTIEAQQNEISNLRARLEALEARYGTGLNILHEQQEQQSGQ